MIQNATVKMKVRIPLSLYQLLEQDACDFGMKLNRFCNEIVKWAENLELSALPSPKKGQVLSFDLNKENQLRYQNIQRVSQLGQQEWLYAAMYSYAERPKYRREEEIFRDVVQILNLAIKKSQRCQINYKEQSLEVEPAFLHRSAGGAKSYLVVWDYISQSYKALRLVHIKTPLLSQQNCTQLPQDTDLIENYKIHFDPFLSWGQTVKIRLSPKGFEMYQKRMTNRPKLLENKGDLYTFECSQAKAKVYFAGFLSQCEIVEPLELRNWMHKELSEALSHY